MFDKENKNQTVRVRLAPSPTGYLHIGTARTALFNWLFAKKHNGKFILRVEDTDLERSDKKYEKDILEWLRWLGLNWDEGPYRQSERLDIYASYLQKLLDQGNAYYCGCSKENLEKKREEQLKRGESPRYDGKCRDKNIPAEKAQLIRFKIEPTEVAFTDLIRGEILFDAALIGDIAIAKNLKTPLYNFAVVIDDYEMRISHVIRGEDHIANTPKQILIQKALGFSQPFYAHLPLILDPDKSKMSKRLSAASVKEYKDEGYLPEALLNFMALLGWHPVDDQEKMALADIVQKFDISRVQKSGAVFDIKKLTWLNSQYIKEKTSEELLRLIEEFYGEKTFPDRKEVKKLLNMGKDRMEKLSDFKTVKESFDLSECEVNLLCWKDAPLRETRINLEKLLELIKELPAQQFNRENLEAKLMPFADSVGRGETLWPLRVALTGKEKSPGPFEVMEVTGKEEAIKRIESAIRNLSKKLST